MKNQEINLELLIDSILRICPRKKLTYFKSPECIVSYGNSLKIKDCQAIGNPGYFTFTTPEGFLHGLCSINLKLDEYEKTRIIRLYNELMIINHNQNTFK